MRECVESAKSSQRRVEGAPSVIKDGNNHAHARTVSMMMPMPAERMRQLWFPQSEPYHKNPDMSARWHALQLRLLSSSNATLT